MSLASGGAKQHSLLMIGKCQTIHNRVTIVTNTKVLSIDNYPDRVSIHEAILIRKIEHFINNQLASTRRTISNSLLADYT